MRHVVVVQARSLQVLIGEIKTEWPRKMQLAADYCGSTNSVTRVGGNTGAGEKNTDIGTRHGSILAPSMYDKQIASAAIAFGYPLCGRTWNTEKRDCSKT